MSDPLAPDRPRRLLADLRRLVEERAPAEREIPSRYEREKEVEEKQYREAREANVRGHAQEKQSADSRHKSARRSVVAKVETQRVTLEREYEEVRVGILARFKTADSHAKRALKESRWEATTIFEATKDGPPQRLKAVQDYVAARRGELQAIMQHPVRLLWRRWQWQDQPEPEGEALPDDVDPQPRFAELMEAAKEESLALHNLRIPSLFEGARPIGLLILIWLFLIYPSIYFLGWQGWQWIAVSAGAAVVLWIGLGVWLFAVAKHQVTEHFVALGQRLADADAGARRVLEVAKATFERESAAILERLQTELKRADENFTSSTASAKQRRDTEQQQAQQKYPPQLTELTLRRERELEDLEVDFTRRLTEIDGRYEADNQRLERQHTQRMEEIEAAYQQAWREMADRWLKGMAEFQSAVAEANGTCKRVFLDWSSPDGLQWSPATETPRAIPFGGLSLSLGHWEAGVPRDDRLRPEATEFSLPALVAFPDRCLVIKAEGEERDRAVDAIQATMLRMLIAVPPGKVRFTIIDPVGLGENFSAFMHLADFDEGLVNSRIWTEPAYIEQRLSDLTEHMENVIQVYLRNEFQTIQEYNDSAGEMAEAYRVLVVANFPAGFTEAAAQRLLSIVSSGARCGVHALVSVDTKLKLPHNFHVSDLEAKAVSLRWENGRFLWEDPDFAELPLDLDRPPDPEPFTQTIRTIGAKARDAERVEVPFECVVPERESWWTGSTRVGIDLALGRAGAMKLQHLSLGKGTSQHVLISGKTGSGKSNLLHAVITNAALWYSPDEIQVYLVDFKKGVEFKAYASLELPHARVVAIESEREFGLSVLERLDLELRQRGDRFRNLGVQDLGGFRRAEPDAVLPRVLLIVDEFQELFVEDDRIAQNAALLLDRLVRQGRAFGIHVILGSQTLAGSYSLPRATIGQMAVRIALQCSEADAHLILSEENAAARLLARPGEAIYNDANGLVEGNHPFQVVWLPDHQRDTYLEQIGELAKERKTKWKPPIVFEGNAPADLSRNPLLRELLAAPRWPDKAPAPRAWLGAAVAIKDPTACELVRQGGCNLLAVGHREEAAMGILASCMVSLAVQTPPPARDDGSIATFYVLDGTRPDAPEAGFWQRMAGIVPHPVKVGGPRDAPEFMSGIAGELARREESGLEDLPPIYLIVYDLSRFRDLRKEEDDFGFGRLDEDKPPSPSKQLVEILKEGPPLGIHALVWSDTYNNLVRTIDRQGMRDLELRVVFQMSDIDSSNLIDSPEAGRIGIHRAILYNEGLGELEKFRPYGLPSSEWLAWVKSQLESRASGSAVPPRDSV